MSQPLPTEAPFARVVLEPSQHVLLSHQAPADPDSHPAVQYSWHNNLWILQPIPFHEHPTPHLLTRYPDNAGTIDG